LADLTLPEILRQPDLWEVHLRRAARERWSLPQPSRSGSTTLFVGCGTSYYLAQVAAASFSCHTGRPALALPGSEVRWHLDTHLAKSDRPAVVAISRSGTTTETLWAVQHLKKTRRCKVFTVTCGPESPLAQAADHTILLPEAQEESMIMTGSFTCQLLALFLAGTPDLKSGLSRLPAQGRSSLKKYRPLVEKLGRNLHWDHLVFLGQGLFFGLANEAMMKFTEMTISKAQAFHGMEYRHGPMSLVTSKTFLALFLTDQGREQEERLLKDLKNLGAFCTVFCGKAGPAVKKNADAVFELGPGPEEGRALAAITLLQLMAYFRAKAKGINPDRPKNLNHVVKL
jgi:glucosamine--fructose-6-phosphate aminotransferase (isomerizing)